MDYSMLKISTDTIEIHSYAYNHTSPYLIIFFFFLSFFLFFLL